MNDVQIFYDNYLKEHALGNRIKTHLFHRGLHAYDELIACLTSIKNDKNFVDKMNGIDKVEVPKYQARQLPEYDVFISPQRQRHFHGNADRAYNTLHYASKVVCQGASPFGNPGQQNRLNISHIPGA